jgi:hypothetical protein
MQLSRELYKAEGKSPSRTALEQAIDTIAGQAIFAGKRRPLHNRVARRKKAFHYDLGDGRTVRTTKAGWKIVDSPPILFRTYDHQEPQVEPQKGGHIEELFEFINVKEKHRLLWLSYLVSCLVPDIPHPIFYPWGDQGSGKTVMSRIFKMLIDPSKLPVLMTPKSYREATQMLAHHHFIVFDNATSVPDWLIELLCIASTGASTPMRKLYTDQEEVVFELKTCAGLNGINQLIHKPDFLDRTLLLHLKRIESGKRKTEKELMQRFEERRPYILGQMFDVLARAMHYHPKIRIKNLPRMADFMEWGCAIARGLDETEEDFLSSYEANVKRQNDEVFNSNTLAQAVLTFMKDRKVYDGTIGKVYESLKRIAEPKKEDDTFPRHPNKLRHHLERIRPNLLDLGVKVTISNFSSRRNYGVPVKFKKVPKPSSLSSPSSHKSRKK